MTFSPEIRLLLCCGRAALDETHSERLQTLLHGPLDWEHLLRLARRHKLQPLLYRHLRAVDSAAVPAETADFLTRFARTNTVRNLALTHHLGQVLRLLEAHHIPALVLKGPFLAVHAYGDLALREFNDLDVWVDRRQVPAVHTLLIDSGCRRVLPAAPPAAGREETRFLRLSQENVYTYLLADGTSSLELHWALAPASLGPLTTFEEAWQRRQSVTVGTVTVPGLGTADLLVSLAAHGAKHRWMRLEWLCAFKQTARQAGGADWDCAWEIARRRGVARTLHLALALAASLLDDAPHDISRHTTAVLTLLQKDVPPGQSLADSFFFLSLKDRLWDRMRGYAWLAALPTFSDLAALPETRRRFPWYLLIRPFRLLRKHGR